MKNPTIDNQNFQILITLCLFEEAHGEEVVHLGLWLIKKWVGREKCRRRKRNWES
jgi:hypothetical protein